MKKGILLLIFIFCVIHWGQAKELVDDVNVHIGAISHLLQPTFPTVHLPNSMVRFFPITTPGISDTYVAPKIYGFPLNRPAHRHRAVLTLMPAIAAKDLRPEKLALEYDHALEIATCYYYSVTFEEPEIQVEFTPTERCAFYRLTFPDSSAGQLIIRGESDVSFVKKDNHTLVASENFQGVRQYTHLLFEDAFHSVEFIKNNVLQSNKNAIKGDHCGVILTFAPGTTWPLMMKYGVSYISADQARTNLAKEIPHWHFEKRKQAARQQWNQELGKIEIAGGTDDQRIAFYTALYRYFERMVNINEYGKYFSAYDQQVHTDERPFYVDDWSWDSYRAHHPLRIFLQPQMEQDIIQSYIRMFQQSGWLPTFPQVYGDFQGMIGHHQAAIIADAWFKGLRAFDMTAAYVGLYKNATQGTMIPWREGPATELDEFHREHGWFPALAPGDSETVKEVNPFEKRQAVAVTIEHAYDDWCLGQLAADLGKTEDATLFHERALFYKNVYHPQTGFMTPRTASGDWIEPFDPKRPSEDGCRAYFAEINSWTYSFHVQHDATGLIELMGGQKKFVQRLDNLFNEPLFGYCRWHHHCEIPDATGLVGQFVMGNEQGFHVPYLYVYAGAPWKTQKRVRQLMHTWFRNDLMGICGDEDGGAMSAWYLFSAMGFYPVCPGMPIYVIGSPLFEKVTLHLSGGKPLIIHARQNSPQNRYIQSATLNGQPLKHAWIRHDEICNGGELVFQMGPRANKKWGFIPLLAPLKKRQ